MPPSHHVKLPCLPPERHFTTPSYHASPGDRGQRPVKEEGRRREARANDGITHDDLYFPDVDETDRITSPIHSFLPPYFDPFNA